MRQSVWNDFLDLKIEPKQVEDLAKRFHDLGHPEFQGEPSAWPSLVVSVDAFKRSPYHQAIQFESIQDEGVLFHPITLEPYRLFNLKAIQADPHKALNDWMALRVLDQELKTGYLEIDGDSWMLDAPSEQATIDPIAQKATGHVLTYGLGLGYFLYMSTLNPKVKSLTVVEHNPKVIDLFKRWILPQFSSKIPITFLHDDAYAHFTEANLKNFDYVFVDIWQSSEDGFLAMEKLLETYHPEYEKVDFWIESSCLEMIPALILVWVDKTLRHQSLTHPDPNLQRILRKIDRCLKNDERSIVRIEDLKELMYDARLHRLILSQRLD